MKLMVIDGNSIANRAFYGIRPLTTKDGLYTNAIYGFVTTLLRLLDEEKPEALCVAFDVHAPTFRHKADESYKATRKGMPEELYQQMPVLKEVLRAMNIPMYEMEGYEADDLIGTISRKCEQKGWDCCIVTGDKDSLQLITAHTTVKLVTTRMGQTTTKDMTPESFFALYGFAPIHMIDLKSLMGDSSDNIPGVPGIGEKTAMELLHGCDSMDALYESLKLGTLTAKPSVLKKLAEGEASARKSYFLATIVTDAPFAFDPVENLRRDYSPELYDLFLRLEFSKLIEKLGLRKSTEPMAAEHIDYVGEAKPVITLAESMEALAAWRSAAFVTVSVLPDLTGVIVSVEENEHHGTDYELYFHRFEGNWDALLKLLFASDIRKVAHGVKDLSRTLLENQLPADGFIFDTALAAYLLDATSGHYEIDRLFVSYFHAQLPKALHLTENAFSPMGENHEAEASFLSYNAAVAALYEYQKPKIEEKQLHELFYDIEIPLCRVLAEMELAGVKVDAAALTDFSDILEKEIQKTESSVYDMAGHRFNINSPKQLGEVLFEEQQLPHGKKTKTGWSTSAEVLENLRYESELVDAVLEYRQLSKLKSTYCDGLLKALSYDGRIHTSFQMTATATGRLSSTEPNLQNIPTRTKLGSELRRMFVAEEGNVLVDADYSQIELRILAHIADDRTMIETFCSGEDIHARTASQVFRVSREGVTPTMRRNAKAVNFGIVYGISAFSLSGDIGVSVAEAKEYMDAYLRTFSGVQAYRKAVVEEAREKGYVETLWHRFRDMPELKSSNFNLRSFGERVALNMPIQGTAADIIKLAMVRVHERIRREKLSAKLILQVHDELIVECPEAEAEAVSRILREEMEQVTALRLPLVAEAHSGKNWLEAK